MLNLFLLIAGIAIIVAILAILRSRLLFELQATTLLLFHNDRLGILLYTIVMLPGTILHELSHWLMAELLRVPTGQITILPSEQKLGSVATGHADPFRSLLIGAAPFITGLLALVALAQVLRDWWGLAPAWQLGLIIYGMVVVGNSMLVSDADRKNWPIAIGVLTILGFILWSIGLRLSPELELALSSLLLLLLQVLGLTAGLNLATIGVSLLVRKLTERLKRQKVIREY